MHPMKPLAIAFALLSATLMAQPGPAQVSGPGTSPENAPSYSELHCSGFVTRQAIPRTNFILGSKESPHEGQYSPHGYLFIGGPPLVVGQRYSLLRQVEDPNHEDSAAEQRKKLNRLGSLYQEVGWVTVQSVQKGTSVGTFDFACDTAVQGDIVVPFQEKPAIAFRHVDAPLAPFGGFPDAPKGAILASKDFDQVFGTGHIVYTDFGASRGAKPGDYLLVLRGYAPEDLNKINRASMRLPKGADPAAVNQAKIAPDADRQIPPRVLGEALVLSTTPDSSTAIITRALSEMELGDVVQPESSAPAGATSASVELPRQTAAGQSPSCQPAPRWRRMLFIGHGCKASANPDKTEVYQKPI